MRSAFARISPSFVPSAIAGCAVAATTALSASTSGDYTLNASVSGDNAAPAFDALAHGHVSAFLAHQPLMGLTSILLRLPVVALAAAHHAGELTTYRLGALVCLLPAGLLAGWLVQRRSESLGGLVAAILAAAVVVAGPATSQAVNFGHPEEVLASVLATAAVLAAVSSRPVLAAVLLGLAIGTKQWALLAAPAVLLGVDDGRVRVAALAGAVGLALSATLPLADPSAFAHAKHSVFSAHLTDPFSVWWPSGSALSAPIAGTAVPIARRLPLGLSRSSASAIALSLALLALAALGLRRRARARFEPLALLALLGLLRCVADPTPLQYNFVDVLIPLAAWESVSAKRLPAVTFATMGMVWLVTDGLVDAAPPALSALSLAGSAVLACYLGSRAFGVMPRGMTRAFILRARQPITDS